MATSLLVLFRADLKRRYFVDASECNNDNSMAESSSLDLGQLYGVFILLCGGIVIALVWALGEVSERLGCALYCSQFVVCAMAMHCHAAMKCSLCKPAKLFQF